MKPTIGTSVEGPVLLDLPRLLETRMLVQANSGGGKSWAIRRILEQTAKGVQHLVIDPEGEFNTLREKFDYVICAPHDGDAVANPKTASLLGRRLLESGVSAILDIYDLKAHDRQAFVRLFLEAIINAPKSLWHPVIIVLDEAHVFAPQTSGAEAGGAVIDLATRGRKRGQCLIAATQRLSKLHKDVAAELLNKMIGRTGLDVDVKRAADELGIAAKDRIDAMRRLPPGVFHVFGPAISQEVVTVTVGDVKTTHPKPGDRLMTAPPAPSKAILEALKDMADLQKEAEHEARTISELKQENANLKRQNKEAIRAAVTASERSGVPLAQVEREVKLAVAEARKQALAERKPVFTQAQLKSMARELERVDAVRTALLESANEAALTDLPPSRPAPSQFKELSRQMQAAPIPKNVRPFTKQPENYSKIMPGDVHTIRSGPDLTGPEKRILDAIAWMNSIGVPEPEQTAVAFMAGYTIGGGAWNNPRGSLRVKGLIEYKGDTLRLTPEGEALANLCPESPTVEELHRKIMGRLPGPERRLLHVLLDAYPDPVSNDDLAAAAGYQAGGGAFNNPRGRLKTLGLVEYPGRGIVRARDILFPNR